VDYASKTGAKPVVDYVWEKEQKYFRELLVDY
jgi:hypothetical protein